MRGWYGGDCHVGTGSPRNDVLSSMHAIPHSMHAIPHPINAMLNFQNFRSEFLEGCGGAMEKSIGKSRLV